MWCVSWWAHAAPEECGEAGARGGARTGGFAMLLFQALCSACSLVVAGVAEMTFDKREAFHLIWIVVVAQLRRATLHSRVVDSAALAFVPLPLCKIRRLKIKSQQLQDENCQQSLLPSSSPQCMFSSI